MSLTKQSIAYPRFLQPVSRKTEKDVLYRYSHSAFNEKCETEFDVPFLYMRDSRMLRAS